MDRLLRDSALSPAQSATLAWVLAPICSAPRPPLDIDQVFAATWRSSHMARFALGLAHVAGECRLEGIDTAPQGEVRCLLRDRRDRQHELLVTFESIASPRITRLCSRPLLAADVDVRPPRPEDADRLTQLEHAAPIRRQDGSEVVIDHNGTLFDRHPIVTDHRWLAAFQDDRMVAVQGVMLATAPIGGRTYRVAYNHYSRSDPRTRGSGNQLHLIATLYRDVAPTIDQFLSVVDVQNTDGLRLSFGEPWPTRVRRLFLPVAALSRRAQPPSRRAFDAEHAAALLNATHAGLNLWVPRSAAFLLDRRTRAPSVYGRRCWRSTDHAVLAVWPSLERRTYCQRDSRSTRTLALVLDYGFAGVHGRDELIGLLRQAADELRHDGVTHLVLFVSDDHPPTAWLTDLAEAQDTYAICAPVFDDPAPPDGPVYVDHALF